MKTTNYILMLAAAVCAAASCTKVVPGVEAPTTSEQMSFTAVAAGHTKTVIENGKNVYWSPQDQIKIFYGSDNSGKFTSSNTEPAAKAVFTGSFDNFEGTINVGGTANDFWAVYPYSTSSSCDGTSVTVEVSSEQVGLAGSFAPELFPCIAKSQNLLLAFWNVCGGVKFTVTHSDIQKVVFKGNNKEVLAGNFRVGVDSDGHPSVLSILDAKTEVSVSAPNGGCFTPGVDYYMVLRPVELAQGFTMTFEGTSGNIEYTHNTAVEIKRSIFAVLEGKDIQILSGANSFIISQYGPVSFDARYKGNSQETVGEIASAEVLWESFGNDIQPAVGDIVKNVSVQDGIVSFTAAGNDGNAVIAVKDAAGDILWSWHIWVCKGFDPVATAQDYNNNAGTVMDRNLGATSTAKGDIKALGLLYEWGRKDPFLSGQAIKNCTPAKSTIAWPSAVSSDASNGTINYTVKHPTTFVKYNYWNKDWYYTGNTSTDNTRWNRDKTMYDPCPKGWRVPDGGSNGLWANALYSVDYYWISGPNWDLFNLGTDFGSTDKTFGSGTIWYPASGCLDGYFAELNSVGSDGLYWSCTPDGSNAFRLDFNYIGGVHPARSSGCGVGLSVRCVKQL